MNTGYGPRKSAAPDPGPGGGHYAIYINPKAIKVGGAPWLLRWNMPGSNFQKGPTGVLPLLPKEI